MTLHIVKRNRGVNTQLTGCAVSKGINQTHHVSQGTHTCEHRISSLDDDFSTMPVAMTGQEVLLTQIGRHLCVCSHACLIWLVRTELNCSIRLRCSHANACEVFVELYSVAVRWWWLVRIVYVRCVWRLWYESYNKRIINRFIVNCQCPFRKLSAHICVWGYSYAQEKTMTCSSTRRLSAETVVIPNICGDVCLYIMYVGTHFNNIFGPTKVRCMVIRWCCLPPKLSSICMRLSKHTVCGCTPIFACCARHTPTISVNWKTLWSITFVMRVARCFWNIARMDTVMFRISGRQMANGWEMYPAL